MKLIKTLGVALAAVLAFMALAMAGSASAVVICEENVQPCPEAKGYSPGAEIEATAIAPGITINTDIGKVTCAGSTAEGSFQTTPLGEYSQGEISSLSFTCPGICTVTALNLPYSVTPSASGGGNGTLVLANGGNGPPRFAVSCAPIECTLTSSAPFPPVLSVTGGNPAKATVSGSLPEWAGKSCPKKFAEIEGEYEFAAPEPMFIRDSIAPPVLCKKNESPCPAGEAYGVTTPISAELEAESKFKFTYNGVTRESACKESLAEGTTNAKGELITGTLNKLTFVLCGCTVTATTIPNAFEIDRVGGGNGTMTWYRTGGGVPTLQISCNAVETCNYQVSEIGFDLTGGKPAKLKAEKITLSRVSPLETLCSATATWEGIGGVEDVNYKLTAPSPVFVRS